MADRIRYNAWSSDERRKNITSNLEHRDIGMLGLADYSVATDVNEMTGKEIQQMRARISQEKVRLDGLSKALFELERQIAVALSVEEDI